MSAVVSLGAGRLKYVERLEQKNGDWPQWQVCCCGICKTDRALAWSASNEGLVLGHEVVCCDRDGHYYALNNKIGCGACEYCREGLTGHCSGICELGVTHHGGYATRISAPKHCMYSLRLHDPQLGILVEPLACVIHGLGRLMAMPALRGNAEPRILVIGSGVAGKMMAHLLLHRTTARLTLCDIDNDALQWAQDWPIDCQRMPAAAHYHAVIECSGGEGTLDTALSAVRRAGVVMLYGIPAAGQTLPVSSETFLDRELTLLASRAGCTPTAFTQAVRYLEQHQPFFSSMMGKKIRLRHLPDELLHHPPRPGTRTWVTMAGAATHANEMPDPAWQKTTRPGGDR
ncbi:zinc-binding dehydrogenase [Acerihabitans arboris]|nr:zinc-binding dehydrogenase [Acerihabitans arboris]